MFYHEKSGNPDGRYEFGPLFFRRSNPILLFWGSPPPFVFRLQTNCFLPFTVARIVIVIRLDYHNSTFNRLLLLLLLLLPVTTICACETLPKTKKTIFAQAMNKAWLPDGIFSNPNPYLRKICRVLQ
jgi:hypothetical protein